jgi:2-desacetyl-2-hydroxyethyl bacteriochlorophyllide A dehydrogenase
MYQERKPIMKAGVKLREGAGNFEVKEIDVPVVGDDDLLIEIKKAGVCGADVLLYEWIYRGRFPVETPIVLGHECAGIVVETGKNVKGFKKGDRVTTESILGCGHCYYCQQGMTNLCPQWDHVGITFNGTFAEYMRIPARAAHRIPDNVSFEQGALVEPLSIAVHTFDRIRFSLGDTIVIIGPGVIGLLIAQAARSYGAAKIIALGLSQDQARLEKMKEFGADVTIMSDQCDAVQEVMELTSGIGADVVIEAGGTPEAFNLSYQMVRGGGQIAALGYSNDGRLEPIILARQEISILGLVAFTSKHFVGAIKWLEAGKISMDPLISHRLSLTEAETGIQLMRDKQATKVILSI